MGGGTPNLTWNTQNNSAGSRWYINDNGIYAAISSGGWGGSTTNYYLYYNNGFQLSTTEQHNLSFYSEGECPTVPSYTIAATANVTEGGTVEGADVYYLGETCTLTATPAEGYQFVNWTENGEEVSTEATYTFEVDADRELIANFEESIAMMTQVAILPTGWIWWSTYLDISLEQLEEALDGHCTEITAQNGSVNYMEGYGWEGDFSTIDPRRMYKIHLTDTTMLSLTGVALDPTAYSITLKPGGTTWIGFPVTQEMTLSQAFANFTPTKGDVIKAANGTATYLGAIWSGTLKKLEPGKGYVYKSKATTPKTLIFPSTKD